MRASQGLISNHNSHWHNQGGHSSSHGPSLVSIQYIPEKAHRKLSMVLMASHVEQFGGGGETLSEKWKQGLFHALHSPSETQWYFCGWETVGRLREPLAAVKRSRGSDEGTLWGNDARNYCTQEEVAHGRIGSCLSGCSIFVGVLRVLKVFLQGLGERGVAQ